MKLILMMLELEWVLLDCIADVDFPTETDDDSTWLEDVTIDCCTEDESDIDDATELDCATLDWIDDVVRRTETDDDTI